CGRSQVQATRSSAGVLNAVWRTRSVPFLWRFRSRSSLVEIEEAAQSGATLHPSRHVDRGRTRDQTIIETLMIPFAMIVFHKFGDGASEVTLPDRNHPVETLRLDRAHEAFRIGIRVRRSFRNQHDADSRIHQPTPHVAAPLPIPIANRS